MRPRPTLRIAAFPAVVKRQPSNRSRPSASSSSVSCRVSGGSCGCFASRKARLRIGSLLRAFSGSPLPPASSNSNRALITLPFLVASINASAISLALASTNWNASSFSFLTRPLQRRFPVACFRVVMFPPFPFQPSAPFAVPCRNRKRDNSSSELPLPQRQNLPNPRKWSEEIRRDSRPLAHWFRLVLLL